jgi:hypothetical protein
MKLSRYIKLLPALITAVSMTIRASFPIFGAYWFSQKDYITALTVVQLLGIAGMFAGLEFHAVIIRELTNKISSSRYRKRAVLKNLATSAPRVILGSILIGIVLTPILGGELKYPLILLLIPLIIFLDLLLSEACRIHNACGEFIAGSLLVNSKAISWLFVLPFILITNISIVESIIISYAVSLSSLILIFSRDLKLKYLISIPKKIRANLIRFIVIFKGSRLLLFAGWIGLLNPMVERYIITISDNYVYGATFFFMGSLAAIAHVLSTNIALIPYHSLLLSPNKLSIKNYTRIIRRGLSICFILVIVLILTFLSIPDNYFPDGITKDLNIFVLLLITSQFVVMNSFFSLRMYAAKVDNLLLKISVLEFVLRIGSVSTLIAVNLFNFIPIVMMGLAIFMLITRIYFYKKIVKIDDYSL